MKELDLYYSALRDYCQTMVDDKSHNRFMQASLKASAEEDKLETVRTRCIIDEEWVLAIEKAIPFIEKAIKEDRQFIRKEGETVPIEKAKKVSKDSVAHLARHSDYITHLPEEDGAPLLPDRIYITENESNFAIYENRFLYMLLCYTRDFVELRYTKISELGNTYRGYLKINKHIEIGKRTVTFDATLNDVSKNDRLYEVDHKMNDMIERIEAIRVQISALLMTPLMNEVSKAPMLRPPITRTNVLRMNNNFINAVALYDYLSAYQGDGYTIEEIKRSFSPFSEKMGSEIFETIPILSFLVYKYGNALEAELQKSYEREMAERALQQAKEEANRLKMLRDRVQSGSGDIDEYLLCVDSYTKNLEESVSLLQTENKKSEARISRMLDEVAWQKELEQRLRNNLDELQTKNSALKTEALEEKKNHLKQTEELKQQCDQTVLETVRNWQDRVIEINAKHSDEKKSYELRISELEEARNAQERYTLTLNARLHAYQAHFGDPSDSDLTDEENFKRLEMEREWFESMFKKTWKQTKKRIRRDLLWSKKQETLQTEVLENEMSAKEDEDDNKI